MAIKTLLQTMKKLLPLVLIFITACQPDKTPENQVDFDRTVFLQSYADDFIRPAYQSLKEELVELSNAISNREQAQAQWKEVYFAFLKVTPYNFGPAEEDVLVKSLTEEIATFPIDITLIQEKIQKNNFQFDDFRRDTRGLLTLEYLLFNDEAWSLNGREEYAQKCLEDILQRVNEVDSRWENYKNEFILNDGTSAGSSTSALYNEFVKSFEGLKNFKIGLPLGLRPGQTSAVPSNVEARFSGYSLDFAKQHFETLVSIWNGSPQKGFKAYLNSVEGGEALIRSTEEQIQAVQGAFQACDSSDFSESNLDQNPNLIILHTELQKLTRFFKSDMSSLLGIAITYSSGDGD